MGRHMSNRERIQRMAEEAEAAQREKAAKAARGAKADKVGKARAKGKTPARVKIVWALCVPGGKALATWPYRERAAAEAEAARRSAAEGITYIVRSDRSPMEEGE